MVLDPGSEASVPLVEAAGLDWTWRGEEPVGPWAGTIADGYHFTSDQLHLWAQLAPPLVFMDDLQSAPAAAALVVNSAPDLHGASLGGVPALLGPAYALVAQQYCTPVETRESVRRIVVTFGALDSHNATLLSLRALEVASSQLGVEHVDVVMGGSARHIDAIAAYVAHRRSVDLHVDLPDLAGVYRNADLVVGGGGVSLLERMAMGLPSLTIVLSENQRAAVEGAARAGGTMLAGEVQTLSVSTLAAAIVSLARNWSHRRAMTSAGRALVDGRGAERVASELGRLSALHARGGRA
jgi:spore coat polysaccharide biosynthesis predicted glycosyltransferase SpsG